MTSKAKPRPSAVRCEGCDESLPVRPHGPLPRLCRRCQNAAAYKRLVDREGGGKPVSIEELAARAVRF